MIITKPATYIWGHESDVASNCSLTQESSHVNSIPKKITSQLPDPFPSLRVGSGDNAIIDPSLPGRGQLDPLLVFFLPCCL